jgi:hypothetical protein
MGKNPAAGSLCYPTVTQLTDASVYEKEPEPAKSRKLDGVAGLEPANGRIKIC